jgi:polysaccharide pyruvyl transferase WcaK-like protein
MKAAARLAHYRSYRDGISKAFMQTIGLDTRADPIYPDLAFQLPTPVDSVRTRNGRPLTVGVGLMSYYGWKGDRRDGARIHARYTASMTRFVLWLLDQGYRVRLLMGEESDRETIEDLRKALADQRPRLAAARVTFEPVASLHELMLQIADTDAVVASRFHNIVCSLKMNRPTISLSYAKKNDILMAEMGLGEFCQHIEEIDVDLLVRQFTRLLSRRADIEPLMRDANARLEARLAHQGSVLIDLLSERQQPRQVNALASAVDG